MTSRSKIAAALFVFAAVCSGIVAFLSWHAGDFMVLWVAAAVSVASLLMGLSVLRKARRN